MTEPVNIADAKRKRASKDWERGLLVNKEGVPRKCLANVLHVLNKHPDWDGVLRLNTFTESMVKLAPPPVRPQDGEGSVGEWTENDSTRTCAWFAGVVGFEPSPQMVEQAVAAVAERASYHPVREYLQALKWDGTERLESMLSTYFGVKLTKASSEMGKRFMVSAVARVMRPGCQVDSMLEFGELDAFKGREATKIKSFISSAVDHYRPSYGRRTRDFPRQTVFAGSTNEEQYLLDRTGNRRFWPVACGRIDIEAIARDRDQLWAEAAHLYQQGQRWHMDTAELGALVAEEQADREVPDDWEPLVSKWLKDPCRRAHEGITTADVLIGALELSPEKANPSTSTRAGIVLRKLGFTRRQVREGKGRSWVYFLSTATRSDGLERPDGSPGVM